MAASQCHMYAPGGRSDLRQEASGASLIAYICDTDSHALHKTYIYHCYVWRAFRTGNSPNEAEGRCYMCAHGGQRDLGQGSVRRRPDPIRCLRATGAHALSYITHKGMKEAFVSWQKHAKVG